MPAERSPDSDPKPVPKKAIPPASYHPDKPYLNTAETAWLLGKHVDTLRRYQKRGEGPYWRRNIDGTPIYKRTDIDEYLRSRTVSNSLQASELMRRERAQRRRAPRNPEAGDA